MISWWKKKKKKTLRAKNSGSFWTPRQRQSSTPALRRLWEEVPLRSSGRSAEASGGRFLLRSWIPNVQGPNKPQTLIITMQFWKRMPFSFRWRSLCFLHILLHKQQEKTLFVLVAHGLHHLLMRASDQDEEHLWTCGTLGFACWNLWNRPGAISFSFASWCMTSTLNSVLFTRSFRDNFLVLDIFFEALNYETIEQKKAYDVAGLLGPISSCL